MPETGIEPLKRMPEFNRVTYLIILLFSLSVGLLNAQNPISEDTVRNKKPVNLAKLDSAYHSPQKAALFSAVLPGLGQIYNKKYWKLPIIYAGFATLGYFIQRNTKEYKLWRQAYIDYPDYHLDVDFELTREQIELGKNFYKRQRELSIIGTAGFYILQIIDATVDAHLFNWSVGEDLSLKIEPSILNHPLYQAFTSTNTFGLKACLSF